MSKKTGECYYRDEDGKLWLATSYEDDNGNVSTQSVEVDGEPVAPDLKPDPSLVVFVQKKPWWKRIF